jgi:hypothetical protein
MTPRHLRRENSEPGVRSVKPRTCPENQAALGTKLDKYIL